MNGLSAHLLNMLRTQADFRHGWGFWSDIVLDHLRPATSSQLPAADEIRKSKPGNVSLQIEQSDADKKKPAIGPWPEPQKPKNMAVESLHRYKPS